MEDAIAREKRLQRNKRRNHRRVSDGDLAAAKKASETCEANNLSATKKLLEVLEVLVAHRSDSFPEIDFFM